MPRALVSLILLATASAAQTLPAWVEKSNRNAHLLIDAAAPFFPESAGSWGVNGLDDQITVPTADSAAHLRHAMLEVRKKLEACLSMEKDPLIRQDLQILIAATDKSLRSSEVNERYLLPYMNVGETIYAGLTSLLNDQVLPERRPAAVARLRRYAGMEPGYAPITTLAEQRFRERGKIPGLIGPPESEVEKDLRNTDAYLTGISLLFEKYKVHGYHEAYSALKEQLTSYDDFVRKEVLSTARKDFRLPPELYTLALENHGVDYTPDEIVRLAHASFTRVQGEMQSLAAKIAKERHLASSNYRDVIKALKTEQLDGDRIMPHYEKRLAEIEAIVQREHLVTLPHRPTIVRLATAAETASQPVPHMQTPRLIDNQGERGQFVLPLETSSQGGKTLKYDDFTFEAASWTLAAHEARPGHGLQFDAVVENGVSLARVLFAFNSTNVEGWGQYAEWLMLPYMPDEGKLISLQLQLLRSARAFLDPELQQGKVAPAQAMQILKEDVVCSDAFATEEVERFTFRSPGQAVSYFDGYMRLLEIRSAAQAVLGSKFNVQRFHDFVLSQGLLPPALLRKAVMEEFVAGTLSSGAREDASSCKSCRTDGKPSVSSSR